MKQIKCSTKHNIVLRHYPTIKIFSNVLKYTWKMTNVLTIISLHNIFKEKQMMQWLKSLFSMQRSRVKSFSQMFILFHKWNGQKKKPLGNFSS